jgi:uncharacterized membrane protein YbhN (UPF0104 family)
LSGVISRLRRVAPLAVAAVVGSLCGYYLLAVFPWAESLPLLGRIPPVQFVVVCGGLLMFVWTLRTLRFTAIARAMGGKVSFSSAYLHVSAAIGAGVVTPLQAGEVLKMALLRRAANASIAQLGRVFLLERVVDVVTLGLLTVTFAGGFFDGPPQIALVAAGSAGLAGYISVALWRSAPARLASVLFAGATAPSDRLVILLSTIGCWITTAYLWRYVFAQVGAAVPIDSAIALTGLVSFANMLSAIPAGLGVSEVSTALLLQRLGAADAHAAALALRFLTPLVMVLSAIHATILYHQSGWLK